MNKFCDGKSANTKRRQNGLRSGVTSCEARQPETQGISSAEEIIEEARAGRCVILVGGDEREHTGDVVIPAQFATRQVVNFMTRYARGLVFLAVTPERAHHLKLSTMTRWADNKPTAFALSIEARTGRMTGISAADRARTIAVAIDPQSGPEKLATPGHIFPWIAQQGGMRANAGRAEAAVDIARLAGGNPSAVLCEVMDEGGPTQSLADLLKFACKHRMKLGMMADLIAYHERNERLMNALVN